MEQKATQAHEALKGTVDSQVEKIAKLEHALKHMKFEISSWKRKYECIVEEETARTANRKENSLDFRIPHISLKLREFQRGRCLQSPEFEMPAKYGGGVAQFEFFPHGDFQAREGWCSFRLRIPNKTKLWWCAYLGNLKVGPRVDVFDEKLWWNKYGLQWLNFCTVVDLQKEISVDSDSLVCGVEILDCVEDTGKPMDQESSSAWEYTDDEASLGEKLLHPKGERFSIAMSCSGPKRGAPKEGPRMVSWGLGAGGAHPSLGSPHVRPNTAPGGLRTRRVDSSAAEARASPLTLTGAWAALSVQTGTKV